MKPLRILLITLLTTVALTAATDPRLSIWVTTAQKDPYTLITWFSWDIPVEGQTRGAAFDDGYIWLHSKPMSGEVYYYYQIDFDDNIITSFEAPDVFGLGYGIDVDGDYLWIMCNGFVYHVTKTGSVVSPSPFYVGGGIHDLGWDGEYLWVAWGESDSIAYYKYDVNTGAVVDIILPEYGQLLEWPAIAVDDDGYIYCLYSDRFDDVGGGYYFIYEPNGDDIVYFLNYGFLNFGIDVGAWPVTFVKPASLGTIKALYK
ncbi:MAG: hypothetical protein JSW52_09750 [Candidatus Coatesbacteria bacterium]|nr:MAG: hypothetical protein JSW52_09750 [Candidatus Coatesbacteria bacterium]